MIPIIFICLLILVNKKDPITKNRLNFKQLPNCQNPSFPESRRKKASVKTNEHKPYSFLSYLDTFLQKICVCFKVGLLLCEKYNGSIDVLSIYLYLYILKICINNIFFFIFFSLFFCFR